MKTKKSKKDKKNSIWKIIALISVAAVVLFTVVSGIYLHLDNQKEKTRKIQDKNYTAKTKAVMNQENEARTFLDQPAPEPTEGDNRQVFRIIEVIPHEICSLFPYLVEWGSIEEYDKNVPLGYEGLLMASQYVGSTVQCFSEPNVSARDSKPYTFVKGGIKRETLSNYNVELSAASDSKGKWYRITEEGQPITERQGYFEYVGENKGLYYINVSHVADSSTGDGIRHEVQAIHRDGSESPKGELYVKDAAYYWAKDNANNAKPAFNQKNVVSQTDYNYDLSFSSVPTGLYCADTEKLRMNIDGGTGYDYSLELDADKISSWESGFSFYKGGNYEVESIKLSDTGNYVRIADKNKDDLFEAEGEELDKGYFRLDVAGDYLDVPRYDVTFAKIGNGIGNYRPNEPIKWSEEGYRFVYEGEGKGIYNIPFLYNSDNQEQKTTYMPSVIRVDNKQGRYALTATSKTNGGIPIYGKSGDTSSIGALDYAKVVTNISFKNIDWAQTDNAWTPGVSLGGGDTSLITEGGGWVFVPVADARDMDVTFLSAVQKNTDGVNSNTNQYFTPNQSRIYVYNQERRVRKYCRDNFYNNEWFKLLCYSNNPANHDVAYTQMVDGIGYDLGKTSAENLANETTKNLLNAFDQQYRIEILQKTPANLSPEDVKNADLLYFSIEIGVEGIQHYWNQISEERVKSGLEGLAPYSYGTSGRIPYNDDISGETLMTIYDECIYKRNVAIMMGHNYINTDKNAWGGRVEKNLTKLFNFLVYFKDALTWSYFIPTYSVADHPVYHYNEDYTRILPDGTVRVCKTTVQHGTELLENFNWGFREDSAYSDNGWWMANTGYGGRGYFKVGTKEQWWESIYPFHYNDQALTGQVLDDESKLILSDYVVKTFMSAPQHNNIWKILKHRKKDTSVLTVQITNAEVSHGILAQKFIYGDEFDPQSFDVEYEVTVLGGKGTPAPLQSITLTFEDGASAGTATSLSYNVVNPSNVRHGFTGGDPDGILNPSVTMRKVIVTATDVNGRTASDEAWIIVRESFDLN